MNRRMKKRNWIVEPFDKSGADQGMPGWWNIYDEKITLELIAEVYGSKLDARIMANGPWFLEQLRAFVDGKMMAPNLKTIIDNFKEETS